MRYFDPFKVLAKIQFVAYKLQLPVKAKFHLIFHVSLLKKFKGDASIPYLPLPIITSNIGFMLQLVKALASWTITKGTT